MPAPDFQSEPVTRDCVQAIEDLAQVGGSKSHVNPGGRPESKHQSRILPVPRPPDAAAPHQSPGSTRCAGPWPIPPPLRMDLHDPLCRSHRFLGLVGQVKARNFTGTACIVRVTSWVIDCDVALSKNRRNELDLRMGALIAVV